MLRAEDLGALTLSDRAEGVRLSVYVKPRASRTSLVGVREGALVVAVTAAPVEGEANAAVVRVLAQALGLPARDIVIASGQTGKRKTIDVRGMTAAAARERLGRP